MADLFTGIYPAGIVYADRDRKTGGGDYERVAFLSFRTLELTVFDKYSKLLAQIEKDAAELQGRKGEEFVTTGSGQTITLGYGLLPKT